MSQGLYKGKIFPILYRMYEIFIDNKILIVFSIFFIIVAEIAKKSVLDLILLLITFLFYFLLLILHTIQWAIIEILNIIFYPLVLLINVFTGSANEVFFKSIDPFKLEFRSTHILPFGNPKLAEVFILFFPLLFIFIAGFLIIIFTED